MSLATDLDEPDWPAILRGVQKQVQDRIHTALPAIVRSYDTATQTAEVQLAVQLQGRNVPPLADVPVLHAGGSQGFLHVPLSAGDTCLVVFCESDFSRWWGTGSVSAPAQLERHGLNAVAIPGLRRAAAPLTVTGGHVTLAASGRVHLGSDGATSAPVLQTSPETWKTTFDTWAAALPATGVPLTDAAFKAAMQALGTALTSAGWPGNFNATKVRAT